MAMSMLRFTMEEEERPLEAEAGALLALVLGGEIFDDGDDEIVADVVSVVRKDVTKVAEEGSIEVTLEGVADDGGADEFETASFTINTPSPASRQVALFEPKP
jgi:hypothetical protein